MTDAERERLLVVAERLSSTSTEEFDYLSQLIMRVKSEAPKPAARG
jgi:hypothetical protein